MGGGDTEPEHILITLPFPEPSAILDKLQKDYPSATIEYHEINFSNGNADNASRTVPPSTFNRATVLVTLSTLPPDPAKDAPRLKLVHFISAGINAAAKHPIYTSSDVPLSTSNGVHGPQISEWVVMTTLVQSHQYNVLYERQKKHEWNKTPKDLTKLKDMVGQRIGILGYGSIGRQVGRVAKAMGMDVLAYTATPKETPESKEDSGYIVPGTGDAKGEYPSAWYSGLDKQSLHHFLKQDLDILLISLPLTNDTRHMLGQEEFDILSARRTFVSNISRGQIIKQDDLIEALRAAKLRGAALDVTDPEPLPAESPLWDMENVTITPHISGLDALYVERTFAILELNLMRLAKCEKLINVVNRKRGY